jgi:hypothetical protein
MLKEDDDEESDRFKEWISEAYAGMDFELFDLVPGSFKYKLAIWALRGLPLGALALALAVAALSHEGSFNKLLPLELFGGCATFALAPALVAQERTPWWLRPVALLASGLLGLWAYAAQGRERQLERHILLELSVGLALCVALEHYFKRLEKFLKKVHAKVSEQEDWE